MASKKIAKKDSLVAVVASKVVQGRILVIRNRQVMLDEDLAELYRVETKDLTRAVRRNKDRFPDDFMFQLTKEEFASLRLQTGASKEGRGGRRYPPFVFTEQGVAMLSSVLRSKRAVAVNIEIMRPSSKSGGRLRTSRRSKNGSRSCKRRPTASSPSTRSTCSPSTRR